VHQSHVLVESYITRPSRQTPKCANYGSPLKRCYIDLKIGGTIFSAAWICFNDFGFLPWVPEVPKASDLSPIPPACLLAAIRRVPVNYRAG
jgi:hypothetical protein